MPGLDRTEIERRMGGFAWYHTIELAPGLTTPGQYDHRRLLAHYGIPGSLAGKSVLDVGPAHGFFAFEFESRGAARVVTVELPRWSDHDASPDLKTSFETKGHNESADAYLHGALDFAVQARGSKVEQRYCNIYDLDPDAIGRFDIVFCASVLVHLTDPLRALYAIRKVTGEHAILATTIHRSRWRRKAPVALFRGTAESQTFWAPTVDCLERWALAAGFARVERVSTFRLASTDGQFDEPHATIRAWV